MMFTHEQLTHAVRELGRDGKPFSSAAVRKFLGMPAQDKRALTRFNNEFREFQKASPNEIEKLANNRYRLCSTAAVTEPNPAIEAAVPSEIEAAVPSEIEAVVPSENEAAAPSVPPPAAPCLPPPASIAALESVVLAPSRDSIEPVAEAALASPVARALSVVELDGPSHGQTRVEIHDATPPGERDGSAVEVQLAPDDAERPAAFNRLRRALVRGYRVGVNVAAHVSRASALLRPRRGQAEAPAVQIDATGS